jgi:SAM-dependent methyltransferase
MLVKYRETAAELGLSDKMTAVQGNLLASTVQATKPALTDEELSGFDLAAICLALHHVDDVELAVGRLADRLRPGGVLLIIDWMRTDTAPANTCAHSHDSQGCAKGQHSAPQDLASHPAAHTISHDWFTRDEILGLFSHAGCQQSSFVLADRLSDVPRFGKLPLFFARATKP